MGQIIADIERNSREIIRIEVSEFKGKELINLRIWYTHFDGTYRPTQKGVALDVTKFEELKSAVEKIESYLKDRDKGDVPVVNEYIEDQVEVDSDESEDSEFEEE